MMNRKTLETWGFWCAVASAGGVSAKAIFGKLAYAVPQDSELNAIVILALRMLFAAPFFLAIAWRFQHSKKHRPAPHLSALEWAWIALVGMMGYYISSFLDFWGLVYISAGLERLILMTYPSITVLAGALLFHKKVTSREIVAMILMYLGIIIAVASDLSFSGDPRLIWFGAFLVFAASVIYSGYMLGAGRYIVKLGSTRFTLYSMAASTLGIWAHYLVSQPWGLIFSQSATVYAYLFAMAIFSTVLPVTLLGLAIRFIGAARASMVGMLGPILTIILGWIFLNEPMSVFQVIGAFFVILGIMLLSNILDSIKHLFHKKGI